MSTIAKIGGPKVREDRAARRRMLREAQKARNFLTAKHGFNHPATMQAATIAAFLERVQNSSAPGAEKNKRFAQVARELASA